MSGDGQGSLTGAQGVGGLGVGRGAAVQAGARRAQAAAPAPVVQPRRADHHLPLLQPRGRLVLQHPCSKFRSLAMERAERELRRESLAKGQAQSPGRVALACRRGHCILSPSMSECGLRHDMQQIRFKPVASSAVHGQELHQHAWT